MAFSRDLKVLGRLLRKFCMLFKASIAVPEVRIRIAVIPNHKICSQIWTLYRLPSTTSMTQRPSRDGTWLATAVCTAMAPPILCPMIMMGGGLSPYRASITLPISLLKKTSDNQFTPGFPEWKLFWYIELNIQCVCVSVRFTNSIVFRDHPSINLLGHGVSWEIIGVLYFGVTCRWGKKRTVQRWNS